MQKLNWSGERLETYITDETMVEHLHRYSLAVELVKDKRVLDVACGEGYGANILAKSANHVTAVDIDSATIENAKLKYKSGNLHFQVGSILHLPFGENDFDIITCFETLEHVEEHEKLITELKRVLTIDGLLLISTPEKFYYSDNAKHKNTFHKKELYGDEFKQLLNSFFKCTTFFQQSSHITSTIIKINLNELEQFYTGDYSDIKKLSSITPVYWIALASDEKTYDLPSSIYYHQQQLAELINNEKELIKKTITYRFGKFILYPFKKIRNLLYK